MRFIFNKVKYIKISTDRAEIRDKIIAFIVRNTMLNSLTEIAIINPMGIRGKISLLLRPTELYKPFLIDDKPYGSVGARRLRVIYTY